MLWCFSGAPGQFPYQVLWSAMLSILLSYLKNVEYQQWLSLGHCQLLYEAILAECDGSQCREGSARRCCGMEDCRSPALLSLVSAQSGTV